MLSDSKILIVDDDLMNTLFIRKSLEKFYTIFEAHDGKEALEKIPDILPDLILLDWNMPQVNGLDVLKTIKSNEKLKSIQVIMMTGMMTELNHLIEAFEYEVIDFIRKPFEFPELQARVKSALKLIHYHKLEIQHKNQELVSLAMKRNEHIELLKQIFKSLENKSDECKKALSQFKQDFNSALSENSWKHFDEQFNKVYPDFYTKLTQKHTNLTPGELKLCSLLRLNLSTKELSNITYTSPESLKVARSRLRKKLQLHPKENLTGYVMSF
ncbi:MAG: response regulator [Bacteroidales bacterium]